LYLYWDFVKRASEMGYDRVCFGRTPPYSNDIHYQLKEGFGCDFEKEYSLIFSRSHLFSIAYNIYYHMYNFSKKYMSG
jgi:hypothetical protein